MKTELKKYCTAKCMNKKENNEGCLCQSCGKQYKVDLLIPNKLWKKIINNSDNGLLCGCCIMRKIELFDVFDYYFLKKTL